MKYAFLERFKIACNNFCFFAWCAGRKFLKVPREHKKALGWTIVDIKGIRPSICTHKTFMEEEYKPKVQPQMRLTLV